jgi:hypothetical protein
VLARSDRVCERVVEWTHLTATPPSFEKGDRDDIVSILWACDQLKAGTSDTIPVTVEEDTESFTIVLERRGPCHRVVRSVLIFRIDRHPRLRHRVLLNFSSGVCPPQSRRGS